ncbi:disease resistance protein RUN1-like [Nymphaea colorata]|nr:disease resistance protein RUN1-like [Nymphaea colorata]
MVQRGEFMDEVIGVAMEGSRIFLPIFSKSYADCKFCLSEVAKMLEFKGLILPIFYDVQPSQVGNQRGPYEIAFEKHENDTELNQDRVVRWRTALKEAGKIKGFVVMSEAETGQEHKLIPLIIRRVLDCMNKMTPVDVAKYPVGLDSRVNYTMKLLDLEACDVRMIGIHGPGGIGKTTVAKATFNKIGSRFEARCFISNVKNTAKQFNGLVSLQKRLITEVLKDRHSSINDVSEGISQIKRRIYSKRVLIVLDDVDDNEQLNALVGSQSWFCQGSRIIITTRNEHILNVHRLRGFDTYDLGGSTPEQSLKAYSLQRLNHKQSLELFSFYAFGKPDPSKEFAALSEKVVSTAEGLPLTLEVLGSFFFGKDDKEEWEDAIKRLERHQHEDVHIKLKVSYDELDENEKQIFLDIACFLDKKSKRNAIYMWKDCDLFPNIAIRVLLHKSLIKIDNEFQEFRVHEQIQDMGRHIVSQKEPPELRSRLWNNDEILHLLKHKKGRENIKGIALQSEKGKQTCVGAEAFETMTKLTLLHINHTEIEGDFRHFPKKVKWLEWKGCMKESLPDELSLEKAVILDLSYSMISQVWTHVRLHTKMLGKLKVLNLRCCEKLFCTPNFQYLPCLVELILDGCTSLAEVHESIGCLKSLVFWSMIGCHALKGLPSNIYQLGSLKNLIVEGCPNFSAFPEQPGGARFPGSFLAKDSSEVLLDGDKFPVKESEALEVVPTFQGQMRDLTVLNISGTSITKIPQSFREYSKLTYLILDYNPQITMIPPSFSHLRYLKRLRARQCKWSEDANPSSFGVLPSVKTLDLCYSDFNTLPSCISSSFPNIEELALEECKNLHSLPSLPSSLVQLDVIDCTGLETIFDVSNLTGLKSLSLTGCEQLVEVHRLESLKTLQTLNMPPCRNTDSALERAVFEVCAEPSNIGRLQ